MSWMHRLYETYENCKSMVGKIEDDNQVPLLPICHTTQKAQIEIVIDEDGNFRRAKVIPKKQARTIIPCTEASGGRTSGEAPHPLCDKLQYVAVDYSKFTGSESYYQAFSEHLSDWSKSQDAHPKVLAIFKYVQRGKVIEDLISCKILHVGVDKMLLKKRRETKKDKETIDVFDLLPGRENKKKDRIENWQADAFVRWIVEKEGEECPKTWEDRTLWNKWIDYYSNKKNQRGLCYVTGEEKPYAEQHPAKLRTDGDKAKIISSNDWGGFTFLGRFTDTKENNTYQTCGIGFDVTQKVHSALRWLISRQGVVFYVKDGVKASPALTIVAWAVSGAQIPKPTDDAFAILGEENLVSDESSVVSTAQELALRLKNKIAGYKAGLGDTSSVVIMGLDSATPGRMAITHYTELTGSDFLERLEHWHESCAWIHDYGVIEQKESKKVKRKYVRFVGAPSPKDIAEAAYGSKVDDKLKKATVERILPCIIEGRQVSRDIVESVVHRASNRVGLENWEWNKTLSIACALYRKLNEKEGYSMDLDENRKTRDYLYGRLLAAADCLESFALSLSEKKRPTNAARLMQRFSDRPCDTWKDIELYLTPYKARLGGRAKKYMDVIDRVMSMFDSPDDFTSNKPLSGEFLLGFHCQREKLKPKKNEPQSIDEESVLDKENENI